MPKVDSYLSLIVKFSLAFGLAFQIPILIVVLVRIGVLQVATLRRSRRYAFLICAIASAVLSPPDVLSMVMLLIPMYMLFEVGLFFAARLPAVRSADEDTADDAVESSRSAADEMDAAEESFRSRDEDKPKI